MKVFYWLNWKIRKGELQKCEKSLNYLPSTEQPKRNRLFGAQHRLNSGHFAKSFILDDTPSRMKNQRLELWKLKSWNYCAMPKKSSEKKFVSSTKMNKRWWMSSKMYSKVNRKRQKTLQKNHPKCTKMWWSTRNVTNYKTNWKLLGELTRKFSSSSCVTCSWWIKSGTEILVFAWTLSIAA